MKKLFEIVFCIMVVVTIVLKSYGKCQSVSTNIRLITYTTPSPVLLAGLPFAGPALAIALEEIKSQYGFNVTNVILAKKGLSTCDDAVDHIYMVPEYVYGNYWNDQEPFFILNPGCYDEITLGWLSKEWNIPIMASGTTYPIFYNVTQFPTLVAFAALDFNQLIMGLFDIFEFFSWTSVAVIHDVSKLNTLYSGIADLLMANTAIASQFFFFPIDTSSNATIPYRAILDRVQPVSRVVLLLMMAKEVRTFMITAQRAGRTTGEYVYLCAEPFEGLRRFGNLTWQSGDEDDMIAREAFRSLLQLTSSCYSTGKHPQQAVMDRIKSDGISQYNASYMKNEEASAAALGHYYSLKALGEILHEAVEEKANLRDGRAIVRRFRNRTFSFNGGKVIFSQSGVRIIEYCLRSMNRQTGSLQAVMSYDAMTRQLNLIKNKTIDWGTPDQRPPPNEPACGFMGQNPACKQNGLLDTATYAAAIATVVVLLIICGLIATLWFHHKAAKININWERLEPKDLCLCPTSRIIYSNLTRGK